MAITNKKHRRGGDYGDQALINVKSIEVNEDATGPNGLVRKSQVETIAQATAEGNLVTNSVSASTTTAFTSTSMVSFLAAKQDNMSIDASSTAYLEIVDGTKIKVKQLLSQDVTVDTTNNTLSDWLTANPGHTLEEGDVLILTAATVNQQRSWIHNGGSAGDATDFTRLVTDYNEASIRAMFSSGNDYILYDNLNGSFSLQLGTANNQVGAQTVPVDNSEFSTVAGTTVLAVLKALEAFIVQVDANATGGSATIETRLTNLAGVSGNNLGAFNDTTFPSNSTVKQVLEASLAKHLYADNDRAAIRSQFTTGDANLQTQLDAEIARATGSELVEQNTRYAEDQNLQAQITSNFSSLITEGQTRFFADSALQTRLDTVEGESNVVGSIKKALADANSFTVAQVGIEAQNRIAQDAILNAKIDNLAEGDITFVGVINANNTLSIRSERIAAGDTRNGQLFTNVNLKAGETFVIGDDTDIAYPDANEGLTTYEKGDKLMVTEDVAAGSLLEANVNAVPANQTGLSRQNVGHSTIDISPESDQLRVAFDSITRDQLHGAVEADIDDKVSLTQNNTMTSDKNTHFVTDATDISAQNLYLKRTSNTSDPLSGTKRTLLTELSVSTQGSGDPLAPCYAHAATFNSIYAGSTTDMTIAVAGGNFEASVSNPTSACYATGIYALATTEHLGVNTAVTGVAEKAGISNIGITGFGKAGGAGKDRGGVFAISDLEFLNWAAYRSATPITYPDAALVADAGTSANGKAIVAVGNSIFEGGTVTVPSAVNPTDAVQLNDIKSREYSETFNIVANGNSVINHGLGTKKILLQLWHEDEEVTSAFDIERSVNSVTVYNATAEALVGIDIVIIALM